MTFSFQRFLAYLHKETLQLIRDPSTFLIAGLLPLMLIFIFGYGVSLDAKNVPLGLLVEDTSPDARRLESSFFGTPYFKVRTSYNRAALEEDVTAGRLRGMVAIPQDFSKNLLRGTKVKIQVLADGSETNTAKFVINYAEGVIANWNRQRLNQEGKIPLVPIVAVPRVWFNADLNSRDVLLPGSVAIIMSLIGILLTALVIAREWERGTMEAIMSTPIHISELLFGKLLPYFFLGLGSMTLCVALSIFLFDVPFRGSYLVLLLATSFFLLASLGQGLLISSLARNQFVASQFSIMAGFLPAFVLSGFIFEINSMPLPIQAITYILPPRYFVTILQSSFLSGTPWSVLWPNLLALVVMAAFFIGLASLKAVKRLD